MAVGGKPHGKRRAAHVSSPTMEIRLLGPFEVTDEHGAALALGGRKPRALLARLALEPNRTVSVERLVDDLWGDEVPESATKMIHIHVSALRKVLPPDTLQTRKPGYALAVDPDAIDLTRFERLRESGRFHEALKLWRGAALSEFPEPFAAPEAAHLEERHRVCLEQRIDADLAANRHSDLVGELEALSARHPLRERLRGQLMLALYRCGRQADALASYRAFRTALDEQLGLDPSPRIRELEARILRQDPALDGRPKAEARRGMEPIRYVDSVGGHSIAYQVIGDGPLDLVFVHGWVCTFQAAWEWPALASFYNRLAKLGRLILFDKRGTGLSDRVNGIASLEERIDDMSAVMNAVGSTKAALLGVSEGGPMSTLFAATHPERTQALITMGSYPRRNWAPDYPIGRRTEHDGWLRPSADQWGEYAARRFLTERAPSIADDEEAVRWYASYLVRGASPGAVAQITDMNEEIDVRHVLGTVRVPALVLYREDEYMREPSRYMGARLPRAKVVGLPGPDHLPWEGAQEDVLGEIERFLGELHTEPEPEVVLTTILEADPADARDEIARFRGVLLPSNSGRVRASFDGPARAIRCAAALGVRAGVHTGECELHDGVLSGPALDTAAAVARAAAPGEVLVTSTVHDLVAGAGIHFSERGIVTGPSREWRTYAATT